MDIDWKQTIFHDTSSNFVSPPIPKPDESVQITIRVYKINPIQEIFLYTLIDGEGYNFPMDQTETNEFFTLYTLSITPRTQFFTYQFHLITTNSQYWYNKQGLLRFTPTNHANFKLVVDFQYPSWVLDSIFYQIFPDRFYDGNPSNNVTSEEYSRHGIPVKALGWNETEKLENDQSISLTFFGGDLAGIQQKIPYLENLGINALYLNPIFYALSNHKYDTLDYLKIDPHLGTEQEFQNLMIDLHSHNFHLILDAVINHAGEGHRWMNRLSLFEGDGAFNNPKSPYRKYFYFDSPTSKNYRGWKHFTHLAKLNYKSHSLQQEIFGENGILNYWLRPPFEIDGWRVDCANRVAKYRDEVDSRKIWQKLRQSLKSTKSSTYLIGETFYDPLPLLDGSQLDGVMNYHGFYIPLIRWLRQRDGYQIFENEYSKFAEAPIQYTPKDLYHQIHQVNSGFPFQLQLLNFNQLSNHDIPRFFSAINRDLDRLQIGIKFLFTYVGVPCIYYGDEVGMLGSSDPYNRSPMIWSSENWNYGILNKYKFWINYRKNHKELTHGSIQWIIITTNIISYIRFWKGSITLAIFCLAEKKKSVVLPLWKAGIISGNIAESESGDILEIQEGLVTIHLHACDSKVYEYYRDEP